MFASRSIPPAATHPPMPMSVPADVHIGWCESVRNKEPRPVREFRTVYVQTVTPYSENKNQEDKCDLEELLQKYPVDENQVKSAEPIQSEQQSSAGLGIKSKSRTAGDKDRDFIVKVLSFVLECFTPSANFRKPTQPTTKAGDFDFFQVWAETDRKQKESGRKPPHLK